MKFKKKLLAIEFAIQRVITRESLQIKAIKSLDLKRPLCLIDVGSAKGMMSRWKIIKDQVYAFGFEPDSGARQKLQQNTDFLGGGNIDFPYALSDKKRAARDKYLKETISFVRLGCQF